MSRNCQNYDRQHDSVILHESNKGYVVFCRCCETFSIAYGTVAFNQLESNYLSLISLLDSYYSSYYNKVNPEQRCIHIETHFYGINLFISLQEIEEFRDILNQAYLLFEAQRIINQ